MKRAIVTGASGFVGKHLCLALRERTDVDVFAHDVGGSREEFESALARADIVFHLAGVNRPERIEEFALGNAVFTGDVLRILRERGRSPKVILASSIQAERDNPYGRSKRDAEDELRRYCENTAAEGVAYRLKNLFGKWSRPNYNSVVATFCCNVVNDMPLDISDAAKVVDLTYIDDVIDAFVAELDSTARPGFRFARALPSHAISLGDLAGLLRSFRSHRTSLLLPDYSSRFVRALYGTYLSHMRGDDCAYVLDVKVDERGSLAEFLKSPQFGQIFLSRTKPGVTRGNHFHHTKAEKFMVVEGNGVIRLRHIQGDRVIRFDVSGSEYRVVDIPPGYTHSIENVGTTEMVTLFWSSEVFDSSRPDTLCDPVKK